MPVSELRISDLLRINPAGPAIAEMISLAQDVAFDRAGHLLVACEEGVWRQLRRACMTGDPTKVAVSCARCGAVGLLAEWYYLATEGARGYRQLQAQYPGAQQMRLYKMRHRCRGGRPGDGIYEWMRAELDAVRGRYLAARRTLLEEGGNDGHYNGHGG